MPEIPGELFALWLALLLDRLLRDPPNALHPVAWMGAMIGWFKRMSPVRGRLRPFLAGLAFVVLGSTVSGAVGAGLERILHTASGSFWWPGESVVLWFCFAASGLSHSGRSVETALADDDLPEARRLLSYHLVSRDTSGLNESQVAAATIESLAENTTDSVVAPLFYYCLGGLPAVLVYRFVNTGDAMLGYRDERHEWLGKAPARLDDLLNLVPARLTALLVIAAGSVVTASLAVVRLVASQDLFAVSRNGEHQSLAASVSAGGMPSVPRSGVRQAIGVWWRDCRTTASPNAGHSMSAAAGVLGIELEKTGCYRLGSGQRHPERQDISRSIRLLQVTVILAVLVDSLILFAVHESGGRLYGI